MSTLLLTATGDLDITGGRFTLLTTSDADRLIEYKQKMNARLNSFKGEWRYDLGRGVPYYERIFVKNPSLAQIRDIFSTVILSVPGTKTVTFANVAFNAVTRIYSFSFSTTTDFSSKPIDFNQSLDLYKDAV